MVIKYKKPSAFLANFIEHFWEKNNPDDQVIHYEMETVLPETYLNLTFSFGSPYFRSQKEANPFAKLNSPQLEALHTVSSFYKHHPDNHIFGVKFLACGLYPFVEHDFLSVSNISIDMDLIFGQEINFLAEELYYLPSFESRVERIESFLLQKVVEARLRKFNFVKTATNILSAKSTQTEADICKVAELLNTNYKTLSRYFKEVIGISPKQFAQIQRFERALQLLSYQTSLNCTEVSYLAGYYDQAHFIREFKGFAHQTPSEYRDLIRPIAPNQQRNDFLQFLSPEHLLFYDVEVY